MKCYKCGAEVPAGKMACDKCGAIVFMGQNPPGGMSQSHGGSQRRRMPGAGFSIASMVLGIVALVAICLWPMAVVCGVIGVTLGGYVLYCGPEKRGMAVAGLVCSIVALGICLIIMVIALANGLTLGELFSLGYF